MTISSGRVSSSLILLLIVTTGICFSKANAADDDSPVLIGKVDSELVKPDRVAGLSSRGGGGGSTRDGKWLVVDFDFTLTPDKDGKVNFRDEVQFKVLIEAREEEGRDSAPVFLAGDVTYMMVPTGVKTYGSFYVPADVVTRYHLDKYATQFNVNVQAYVGGQSVDSKDKRKEDKVDWYKDYKTISGMVFDKDHTPFLLNDLDRYPTIKPK